MREAAAMRLPAQIIAGLGVALLFGIGARLGGWWCGLLCAGWFIALPRVWFHAGLHAFDVPVAVAILAVALAYRASHRSGAWGVGVGVVLGIAIAIKHNALFLGPLLTLHYWTCLLWARLRHGQPLRARQLVPLPLWSMAILGPLVAWLLWPWLWSDPVARLSAYFEFHRHHSWYNMEFLGRNYNQPPMPIAYPWVSTLATVPLVSLLLAATGLALTIRRDIRSKPTQAARPASWWAPLPAGWPRLDGLGVAGLALFPLLLISLPTTPIFGGTKHWLTAYPFLAIAAAYAWAKTWRGVDVGTRKRWLEPLALAAVLAPSVVATIDGHPYDLSQYTPAVGGPRGAAQLGLNRGFWGHAAVPLLPEAARVHPGRVHLYLHDLHPLVQAQYAREGRWPPNVEPAPLPRADAGMIFIEPHMTTLQVQLWRQLGTTAPSAVITLDDVPLTSLYAR
jgi:4-amino-4-deoxy-L-arabinose transferase-like glycosyltransferase